MPGRAPARHAAANPRRLATVRRASGRQHHHLFETGGAPGACADDLARFVAGQDLALTFRTGVTGGLLDEVVRRSDKRTDHVMEYWKKFEASSLALGTMRLICADLHQPRLPTIGKRAY